jgi:hypothetical protein
MTAQRGAPCIGRLLTISLLATVLAGCQSSALHSTTAASAPPFVAPSASPSAAVPSAAAAPAPIRSETQPPSPVPVRPTRPADVRSAVALLAGLSMAGRGPKTGYSRAEFGPAWADVDHNGCHTRNDILNRDLQARTWRAGTHDCVVLSGRFTEPYTGQQVVFSNARASAVQIDHVVALSDAWQKGAAGWPARERLAFANDPLELLAVDGPTNEGKGDGDAATWLPSNKGYRCTYVARQVAVKAKYKLTVTQAEHDAIAGLLAGCTGQPAPTVTIPASSVAAPPVPAIPPAVLSGPDTYYSNCAAVRAAGKAPLHRGDPGYRAGLDRDNDGVACE